MKPGFLNSKDFWSGAMLIAMGGAALAIARDYPFGTALRMGPGYFPIVLGAILVLFGLYLAARGLFQAERIIGAWSPRALVLLPLALVLFGILVQRAGFIPALVAALLVAAAGGREFRLFEVVVFAALLTVFCVALFIWALGLPYPLFAWG